MPTISYQLYSSRNWDVEETFAMLSELGVKEVEGFGPYFEERNAFIVKLAKLIQSNFNDFELVNLNWCLELDSYFTGANCGLKVTALASAIFLDLGIHPRTGPALFQLLSAPGLLAHGLEMSNKPLSAMPFVPDSNYHHLRDIS